MNTLPSSDIQNEEIVFPKAVLKDPLSEETRKERRSLLAVSSLGIAMVYTGLIPTKISALGVDFDKADQNLILTILAAVIGYFLIAFILYSVSDFWSFRVQNFLETETYLLNKINHQERVVNSLSALSEQEEEVTDMFRVLSVKSADTLNALNSAIGYIEKTTPEKKVNKTHREFRKNVETMYQQISAKEQDFATHLNATREKLAKLKQSKEKGQQELEKISSKEKLRRVSFGVLLLRMFLDFGFPVVVSIWAIIVLLRR